MRVSNYEIKVMMRMYNQAEEIYAQCMEELGLSHRMVDIPLHTPAVAKEKEKGSLDLSSVTKKCESVSVYIEEILLDIRLRAPGDRLEDMEADAHTDIIRIATQWICYTIAHECMHVYQMEVSMGYEAIAMEMEAFNYENRPHEREANQYAHAFVHANRSHIEHLSYVLLDELNEQELAQA